MIKLLPIQAQSRLRSSITICSPCQCVDELVLNALDAGAGCVAVRVDLSRFWIQVVDNGNGIAQDALVKVGKRYMTSKCHSLDDLKNLSHYGYRGEALASIRDIAKGVEIQTREKTSQTTYTIEFTGDKSCNVSKYTYNRPSSGTTVTINDLFHKLPVRKKCFSECLELERIRERLEAFSLMHPHVSISLRSDASGGVVLQSRKSTTTLGAFRHLFGGSIAMNLADVQSKSGNYCISGLIGKEGHTNKNIQYVFVNGRLVLKSKIHKTFNFLLSKSLVCQKNTRGKEQSIPALLSPSNLGSPANDKELYPVFVIKIVCPYSEYDITFDPAKTLVEFRNWDCLAGLLQATVNDFLQKENLLMRIEKVTEDADEDAHVASDQADSDLPKGDADQHSLSSGPAVYAEGINSFNAKYCLASVTAKRPVEKLDCTSPCSTVNLVNGTENMSEDLCKVLVKSPDVDVVSCSFGNVSENSGHCDSILIDEPENLSPVDSIVAVLPTPRRQYLDESLLVDNKTSADACDAKRPSKESAESDALDIKDNENQTSPNPSKKSKGTSPDINNSHRSSKDLASKRNVLNDTYSSIVSTDSEKTPDFTDNLPDISRPRKCRKSQRLLKKMSQSSASSISPVKKSHSKRSRSGRKPRRDSHNSMMYTNKENSHSSVAGPKAHRCLEKKGTTHPLVISPRSRKEQVSMALMCLESPSTLFKKRRKPKTFMQKSIMENKVLDGKRRLSDRSPSKDKSKLNKRFRGFCESKETLADNPFTSEGTCSKNYINKENVPERPSSPFSSCAYEDESPMKHLKKNISVIEDKEPSVENASCLQKFRQQRRNTEPEYGNSQGSTETVGTSALWRRIRRLYKKTPALMKRSQDGGHTSKMVQDYLTPPEQILKCPDAGRIKDVDVNLEVDDKKRAGHRISFDNLRRNVLVNTRDRLDLKILPRKQLKTKLDPMLDQNVQVQWQCLENSDSDLGIPKDKVHSRSRTTMEGSQFTDRYLLSRDHSGLNHRFLGSIGKLILDPPIEREREHDKHSGQFNIGPDTAENLPSWSPLEDSLCHNPVPGMTSGNFCTLDKPLQEHPSSLLFNVPKWRDDVDRSLHSFEHQASSTVGEKSRSAYSMCTLDFVANSDQFHRSPYFNPVSTSHTDQANVKRNRFHLSSDTYEDRSREDLYVPGRNSNLLKAKGSATFAQYGSPSEAWQSNHDECANQSRSYLEHQHLSCVGPRTDRSTEDNRPEKCSKIYNVKGYDDRPRKRTLDFYAEFLGSPPMPWILRKQEVEGRGSTEEGYSLDRSVSHSSNLFATHGRLDPLEKYPDTTSKCISENKTDMPTYLERTTSFSTGQRYLGRCEPYMTFDTRQENNFHVECRKKTEEQLFHDVERRVHEKPCFIDVEGGSEYTNLGEKRRLQKDIRYCTPKDIANSVSHHLNVLGDRQSLQPHSHTKDNPRSFNLEDIQTHHDVSREDSCQGAEELNSYSHTSSFSIIMPSQGFDPTMSDVAIGSELACSQGFELTAPDVQVEQEGIGTCSIKHFPFSQGFELYEEKCPELVCDRMDQDSQTFPVGTKVAESQLDKGSFREGSQENCRSDPTEHSCFAGKVPSLSFDEKSGDVMDNMSCSNITENVCVPLSKPIDEAKLTNKCLGQAKCLRLDIPVEDEQFHVYTPEISEILKSPSQTVKKNPSETEKPHLCGKKMLLRRYCAEREHLSQELDSDMTHSEPLNSLQNKEEPISYVRHCDASPPERKCLNKSTLKGTAFYFGHDTPSVGQETMKPASKETQEYTNICRPKDTYIVSDDDMSYQLVASVSQLLRDSVEQSPFSDTIIRKHTPEWLKSSQDKPSQLQSPYGSTCEGDYSQSLMQPKVPGSFQISIGTHACCQMSEDLFAPSQSESFIDDYPSARIQVSEGLNTDCGFHKNSASQDTLIAPETFSKPKDTVRQRNNAVKHSNNQESSDNLGGSIPNSPEVEKFMSEGEVNRNACMQERRQLESCVQVTDSASVPANGTFAARTGSENIVGSVPPTKDSATETGIQHHDQDGNSLSVPAASDSASLQPADFGGTPSPAVPDALYAKVVKEVMERNHGCCRYTSMVDPKSGRTMYIHLASGNTSYEKPQFIDKQKVKDNNKDPMSCIEGSFTQHPFLSHDAGPVMPRSKEERKSSTTLVPSEKISKMLCEHVEKQNLGRDVKWRDTGADNQQVPGSVEKMLLEWDNPVFKMPPQEVLSIDMSSGPRMATKVYNSLQSIKFTKDMFQSIKVIEQVDQKFIACLMSIDNSSGQGPQLLVFIDQHAAHERIRLEQFIEELYDEDERIRSRELKPPIKMTVGTQHVRVMTAKEKSFKKIGVTFKVQKGSRDTVLVEGVPRCLQKLVEKEDGKQNTKGPSSIPEGVILDLLSDHIQMLQNSLGAAGTIPKPILKLLWSKACRGAIKFGDSLSLLECEALITSLSKCKLPFQCAHGRPSMVPIIDLRELEKTLPTMTQRPNLQKLKEQMNKDIPCHLNDNKVSST